MISDVLSDALGKMEDYLANGYGEPGQRGRLVVLMAHMEAMRIELDAFPDWDEMMRLYIAQRSTTKKRKSVTQKSRE